MAARSPSRSTATTSARSTGCGSGSPRERSWWLPRAYEGGPWSSPASPWSSPDWPWWSPDWPWSSPDWPASSSSSLLLRLCAVFETHLPKALALLGFVPYLSLNAAAFALRSARQSSAALSRLSPPSSSPSSCSLAFCETHLPKALDLFLLVPYFSLNPVAFALRSARHWCAGLLLLLPWSA